MTVPFVRAAALAEFESEQTGRESEARAALAAALTPLDVSAMTVADVDLADNHVRYVFMDTDVHLAVVLRDPGSEVHLVSGVLGVALLSGGLGVAGGVVCARAGDATMLAPTNRVVVSSR